VSQKEKSTINRNTDGGTKKRLGNQPDQGAYFIARQATPNEKVGHVAGRGVGPPISGGHRAQKKTRNGKLPSQDSTPIRGKNMVKEPNRTE